MLDARLVLGVSRVVIREEVSLADLRDARDALGMRSETRDFKNTVCGTTPNFGSSMSPIVLMFFSVSGSRLNRDAKLMTDQIHIHSNKESPLDQPRHCICQSQDVLPYG